MQKVYYPVKRKEINTPEETGWAVVDLRGNRLSFYSAFKLGTQRAKSYAMAWARNANDTHDIHWA